MVGSEWKGRGIGGPLEFCVAVHFLLTASIHSAFALIVCARYLLGDVLLLLI